MKRFVLFVMLLFAVVFGILQVVRHKIGHDLAQPVAESILSPSPTLTIDKNQQSITSLFVPYWALSKEGTIDAQYDQYIYFGVTPDTNGIQKDKAETTLTEFVAQVPDGKKTFLAVQMVDSSMNAKILNEKAVQNKIISQTVQLAREKGFSGVVLDLEMSAIPFTSLIEQINTFNEDFSKAVKQAHLQYAITMYGDTFYRVRPFDIKTLAGDADMVMIMAYDFHKSRANPGPNFPLHGSETYGYDLSKMSNDFLRVVPSQKIYIIFGLFGYDWAVNNAGKAVGQGEPLTYVQIKKQFLDSCTYKQCQWKRDTVSGETEINYTDDDNQKHIVWFEDMQSVKTKQDFLKSLGLVKYWSVRDENAS